MISCSANSLLELAKCFRCVDAGSLADLSLSLACVAANGSTPTPAETNYLLDSDNVRITTSDGELIIVP